MRDVNGRSYHEQVAFQQIALDSLRSGMPLAEYQWKKLFPGSRLPPVIEKLRNAHGFEIDGTGAADSPYVMRDRWQMPTRVAVTTTMKLAYYETDWWHQMRGARVEFDQHACVICRTADDLQVHHIKYRLFAEDLYELITLCDAHHDAIHADSRLKFPSGMTVDQANKLGVSWEFEEWLVPKFALHN
jgi:hypothetical protein